ncbi:unnamed protein product [Adineta steineri]|uniref:phosphoethanolamine N-methyltransferase n=1 Tax=Adineta steineri TaxID=433720 RepID=A0A814SF19_9BILA|nr:unnamed protein product [Adineta steineri]CAF1013090.1 unnamed protein product [Adineta steineri]CAF1147215.1 unnamed protein product [Adineta steineri]CAF1215612.1 unnamed protein product [Adineta steineri]CAF1404760.1 unnamed protein product [Adineta steineri]
MPETAENKHLNIEDDFGKERRSSSSASEGRATMVTYWKRNSNPNLENMMLDTNADKINRFEHPEILECLPDLDGKRVLELGAGIGRFTKKFAQLAKSVVAVDFMESFIEKNRQENSHFGTVEFLQKDATLLTFEPNSFDVVFSNWLFMYLSDEETEQLLQKSLSWLAPGGTLFFRESCFHSSGNIKSGENPTHYRSPRQYIDMCQSRILSSSPEQVFELVFAKALESYYEIKQNNNQVCFLFTKTNLRNHNGYKTLQDFLDHSEYAEKSIQKYESVRGEGYVTIGGSKLTGELVERLNLTKSQRLLNFGCATGGSSFQIAKDYGCEIVGVDISANMIGMAWDRALLHKGDRIRFEVGDGTKMRFLPSKFDAIYSRDVIFHVSDKPALLNNFYTWLKNDGRLLVTDFCCGTTPFSQDLMDYARSGMYTLTSMQEYAELLEKCGFVQVHAEDRSDLYQQYCLQEIEVAEQNRANANSELSRHELDECVRQWKLKYSLTNSGQRCWCVFEAVKRTISCREDDTNEQ